MSHVTYESCVTHIIYDTPPTSGAPQARQRQGRAWQPWRNVSTCRSRVCAAPHFLRRPCRPPLCVGVCVCMCGLFSPLSSAGLFCNRALIAYWLESLHSDRAATHCNALEHLASRCNTRIHSYTLTYLHTHRSFREPTNWCYTMAIVVQHTATYCNKHTHTHTYTHAHTQSSCREAAYSFHSTAIVLQLSAPTYHCFLSPHGTLVSLPMALFTLSP